MAVAVVAVSAFVLASGDGGEAAAAADDPACGAECERAMEADVAVGAAEGSAEVRVTDIVLQGPDRTQGSESAPNRTGSAEVPVRLYEAAGDPWATLVWAHGGSFVHGSLDMPEADWVSRSFAEAGLRVYSVDYVLATEEVKAPAPANDVAAVLRAVLAEEAGPVAVGGASAGANLAVQAALTQAEWASVHGGRSADAVLLEYPTLHREQRADAAISRLTGSLPERNRFDADRIADMYAFYLGEKPVPGEEPGAEASADWAGEALRAVGREEDRGSSATDAYRTEPLVVGELPADRLRLLPATVIINAEADDLRASGEEFAEQLRAAGVSVVSDFEPGTVHGYLNRPDESPRHLLAARATVDRFAAELRIMFAVPAASAAPSTPSEPSAP